MIAGGVESMSRVPLGSSAAGGTPNSPLLRARYPEGLVNQGVSAELIAQRWGLSRERLDAFSAESHRRAADAWGRGDFDSQVVRVIDPSVAEAAEASIAPGTDPRRDDPRVDDGRGPRGALPRRSAPTRSQQRFPDLEWRITPGNSSPLTDGASAVLIMSEEKAAALGLTPRARFHAFAVVGDDPLYMLTGPIPATRRILERSGLSIDDIDAYEVNEAFASVPLAWAAEVGGDPAG